MKNWFSSGFCISGVFISVAKGPGQMAFTVMPSAASSSASARVMPSTAVLLAELGFRYFGPTYQEKESTWELAPKKLPRTEPAES